MLTFASDADSCGASGATPPPRAERWGLPLFCDDRLERLDVEGLLGHDVLQPAVLILELLQPLQLNELHPAVLRFSPVVRLLGNAMRATQVRDFLPCLALFHDRQNLFVAELAPSHRVLLLNGGPSFYGVADSGVAGHGLPQAIRTDNGVPFASAHALYGLSKLAVWWLRLGIRLERIAPGHREQNGRHERLHLTLKTEATRPAAPTVLQQQVRFDAYLDRYSQERPHQALDMATPASRYMPSTRVYRGLDELEYPFHDWTAIITRCGRICWQRHKINVSQVFAGQRVGVKVSEQVWLVTFKDYDLGYFDDETCRLEPIENPFGPKLLPMSPE
jgi:integrase-like protein